MDRMLDDKWKIRESALTLMSELLAAIENDMVIEKPRFITLEERYKIISILFILKFDAVEFNRITAAQEWKKYVENQPKMLRAIMNTLVSLVLTLVCKRGQVVKEVATSALRDLAEKYGDKLMSDILTLIETRMDNDKEGEEVLGITHCLLQMLGKLSAKLVNIFPKKIYFLTFFLNNIP